MACIIGVRFREAGKVYYFDPNGADLQKGNHVIVETVRGVECGEVVMSNKTIADKDLPEPLKRIIRVATDEDMKIVKENEEKEKKAFEICNEKIKNGRVDFRELVKDLAYIFRTRIELRQIGVRDEAKKTGGMGICGRPFCCNTFLGEFQPVSIKMAKEQGMILNPTKISGTCGRLMCCLKYEQDVYSDLLKITPKIGAIVNTPDGKGNVIDVNLITGMLTVTLHKSMNAAAHTYKVSDVTLIKDAQIKVDKAEFEKLKKLENN